MLILIVIVCHEYVGYDYWAVQVFGHYDRERSRTLLLVIRETGQEP